MLFEAFKNWSDNLAKNLGLPDLLQLVVVIIGFLMVLPFQTTNAAFRASRVMMISAAGVSLVLALAFGLATVSVVFAFILTLGGLVLSVALFLLGIIGGKDVIEDEPTIDWILDLS